MIYDYVIFSKLIVSFYSIQYLEERIICTDWFLYLSFFLIQIYIHRIRYIIEMKLIKSKIQKPSISMSVYFRRSTFNLNVIKSIAKFKNPTFD